MQAHLAILPASPYSTPTNMSDSNAYLNSISYGSPHSPVTKLPDYLANTNFAEMYYEAHEILESVTFPTEWNVDDRSTYLSVDSDKLKVNYIGPGMNDSETAAIRANHSMPPQCGLFYFEIDIINKGEEGSIGIGFCTKQTPLNRLPGWEDDSRGYHGDDGLAFCSGVSSPYGPKFTTGDTIGCCLNFRDGTAFYTKNGQHLGIAFRDLKGVLYPSIGLRTRGESIETNFGHKKFKFAIEHYMK
ncbi:6651_t:CDS:2, partial [Diversispora eburnea]